MIKDMLILNVVCCVFDQLLGAARSRQLVELLFSAVFNLYCSLNDSATLFAGKPRKG